jgi:hypothetical protein
MALPTSGKVKAIFLNTDGVAGKEPIFAQLNGESILIPRNEEVEIDVKWLHGVFDPATATEYDHGPEGRGIARPRTVPRYPYQIVSIVETGTADQKTGKAAQKTGTEQVHADQQDA